MNQIELQTALKLRGNYHYKIDGIPGPQHRAALKQAVTEGADRKLTDDVIRLIANGNSLPPSRIYAVRAVEASGAGFDASTGAAIILPEPHRFSRNTNRRFDKTNPTLSYPNWDRTKYPKTQEARWNQLIEMIVLDPDAGFMSASHGLFQILGENYAVCGFKTPFDFVMAMSLSEDAQIEAFLAFITNKTVRGANLLTHLRNGDFAAFALGYNGTAFRENLYDTKLATADKKYAGFN